MEQPKLWPDDRMMLELIAHGKTIKESAAILGWTQTTMNRRLERIRNRLGVSTTMQLMYVYARDYRTVSRTVHDMLMRAAEGEAEEC